MMPMSFTAGQSHSSANSASFAELIKTIQFLNKNSLPHYRAAKDYTSELDEFFAKLIQSQSELISLMVSDLGYTPELAARDLRLTQTYQCAYPYSAIYNPRTTAPEGLIAVHGTWSSPVYRFLDQAVPALLQEGSVLLYCEPEVSRVYCRLAELLHGTKMAENRLSVLPITEPDVLEVLLDHPSIRGIQGQMHLYQSHIYRSRPLSPEKLYNLHFGAHNPVLIMNDADLALIPFLLDESMFYHIRSEVRFNRWFVQEKVFPEVLSVVQAHMKTIKDTSWGSITTSSYQAAFENQKMELRASRQWLLPTDSQVNVCTDFSNCSPLHQIELLGPLLTLTRFKNGPEAAKFAGTTHYSNVTAILTSSKDKYLELAALQRTPYVTWNSVPTAFDKRLESGLRHCSLKTSSSVVAQIKVLAEEKN